MGVQIVQHHVNLSLRPLARSVNQIAPAKAWNFGPMEELVYTEVSDGES